MPPKRLSNAVRIEVGRRGRSSYRSSLVKVNKSRAVLEKEKEHRAMLLSCTYMNINPNPIIMPLALNYQMRDELLNSGNLENDEFDALATAVPLGQEEEGYGHAGHDLFVDEVVTELSNR